MSTLEAPRIRARRTRFDLTDTPREWIPGDLQTTHLIDSLHVALPPGERWFCDVFRDALPLITDDALRDQVRGFIGQEATHAKAHDLGLEHLARHGIDLRAEVAWADRARVRIRRRIKRLPAPIRRRALRGELAAIATIEHYTAVLGSWIVTADLPADADPQMVDLLRWHGAEEMEHRAVAFDLYQHLDGSYLAPRRRRCRSPRWGSSWACSAITARIMALDPNATGNLRLKGLPPQRGGRHASPTSSRWCDRCASTSGATTTPRASAISTRRWPTSPAPRACRPAAGGDAAG